MFITIEKVIFVNNKQGYFRYKNRTAEVLSQKYSEENGILSKQKMAIFHKNKDFLCLLDIKFSRASRLVEKFRTTITQF